MSETERSEEVKPKRRNFWLLASTFLIIGLLIGGVLGYLAATAIIAPVTIIKKLSKLFIL